MVDFVRVFTKSATVLGKFVNEHYTEILTGCGITGFGFAMIQTARATKRAMEEIECEKANKKASVQKHNNNATPADCELTKKETAVIYAKNYVGPVIIAGASTACIIMAVNELNKENAALSAACSFAENALIEYRRKTEELVDAKKRREIDEAIDRDMIARHPASTIPEQTVIVGGADVLCMDKITEWVFYSTREKIRAVVNDLNFRMLDEMYISLNDYYEELGRKPTEIGYTMGWNINRTGKIDVRFTSQVLDDGRPCLVVGFVNGPKIGYRDY